MSNTFHAPDSDRSILGQAPGAQAAGIDDLLVVVPASRDEGLEYFTGAPRDYGPLRIYGGHFIGQGLAAAFATVPEGWLAHSLHASFVRTGDPAVPIAYQVERLRDGGSYLTRVVRALQHGQTAFLMTASFKRPESGDHHQPAMPAVPAAADVMAAREAAGRERIPFPFTLGTGVELEVLDDWSPINPARGEPRIQLWMRVPVTRRKDPAWQQCALAYLSDSTLLFNALRPHGQPFRTHRTTSLDHALWFHGVPDCSDWLFYDQEGLAAADGRGINRGYIFRPDGELLATAQQEGMMRRIESPA